MPKISVVHHWGRWAWLLPAVACLIGCGSAPEDEEITRVDKQMFLDDIRSDKPEIRYEAIINAHKVSPDVIVRLGIIGGYTDPDISGAALEAMRRMVHFAAEPDQRFWNRGHVSELLLRLLRVCQAPEVRREAIQLLSLIGKDEAVIPLARLLTDLELRDDARMALERLPVRSATQALIRALNRTRGEFVPRVIESLGMRRDPAAVEPLAALAVEPDKETAYAAIAALARIGHPVDSVFSEKAVAEQTDDDFVHLVDAYLEYADRQAGCCPVFGCESSQARAIYLAVLRRVDTEQHLCVAMAGLGRVGKAQDADLVAPFLTDESPALRKSSSEALMALRDGDVTAVLTAAMQDAPPDRQAALLPIIARKNPSAGRKLLAQYASADTDPSVRALAIQMMCESGDPQFGAALSAVARDETDPNRKTAIEGCLKLADAHLAKGHEEQARELYQVVADTTDDEGLKSRAMAGLVSGGADLAAYARSQGFITAWHVIGAFPNPDGSAFEKGFFPEEAVDLEAGGELDGNKLTWKLVSTDQCPAVIELTNQFEPNAHVAAYAFATIGVDADREVKLKIGSNDGVVVWLNGEKIHSNNAGRKLTVDEDVVAATLKAGENKLLFKILQNEGTWSFCARITDKDDQPLGLVK